MEPYDGFTDPIDHLESYKVLMIIQEATDALLYIDFPVTIQKAARAWYSEFQLRSIDSFEQLKHSFVIYFNTNRNVPRTSDSLFSIKQGETETLRDFMAHFNKTTLEVKDLNEDIAISIMKRILMKIEEEEYLRHPSSMKASPRSHDRKKYCRFHYNHGHDTE
uniref:Uncharacterized protein LOC105034719 n=1 Tax=Elaeis guineensis var. tenera TaxID=51953 RepID=A0A6I9QFG2_ELAGV|nr:uncharacterized protein LOC105034719 [Elaeis guineensis]